jgi:hypothetical protein
VGVCVHRTMSYSGFVTVMVLSTVDCDYIFDCTEPEVRTRIGPMLQPLFTEATIAKVVYPGCFAAGGGDFSGYSSSDTYAGTYSVLCYPFLFVCGWSLCLSLDLLLPACTL